MTKKKSTAEDLISQSAIETTKYFLDAGLLPSTLYTRDEAIKLSRLSASTFARRAKMLPGTSAGEIRMFTSFEISLIARNLVAEHAPSTKSAAAYEASDGVRNVTETILKKVPHSETADQLNAEEIASSMPEIVSLYEKTSKAINLMEKGVSSKDAYKRSGLGELK
jgi:hypothetical protein